MVLSAPPAATVCVTYELLPLQLICSLLFLKSYPSAEVKVMLPPAEMVKAIVLAVTFIELYLLPFDKTKVIVTGLLNSILTAEVKVTLLAALTKPTGTKSKDKIKMYCNFFISLY